MARCPRYGQPGANGRDEVPSLPSTVARRSARRRHAAVLTRSCERDCSPAVLCGERRRRTSRESTRPTRPIDRPSKARQDPEEAAGGVALDGRSAGERLDRRGEEIGPARRRTRRRPKPAGRAIPTPDRRGRWRRHWRRWPPRPRDRIDGDHRRAPSPAAAMAEDPAATADVEHAVPGALDQLFDGSQLAGSSDASPTEGSGSIEPDVDFVAVFDATIRIGRGPANQEGHDEEATHAHGSGIVPPLVRATTRR